MKITAAAIHKDSKIYTGKNHSEIIHENPYKLKGGIQGFVSDDGDFWGRTAAFQIATEAGQIVKKHGNSRVLYSEDLGSWPWVELDQLPDETPEEFYERTRDNY